MVSFSLNVDRLFEILNLKQTSKNRKPFHCKINAAAVIWDTAFLSFFSSILYSFLVLHFTPYTSQHTHIQPTSALARLRPFLINNGRCPQLIIPANRLLYNMRSTSDRLLYNMWSDRGWPHRGVLAEPFIMGAMCQ